MHATRIYALSVCTAKFKAYVSLVAVRATGLRAPTPPPHYPRFTMHRLPDAAAVVGFARCTASLTSLLIVAEISGSNTDHDAESTDVNADCDTADDDVESLDVPEVPTLLGASPAVVVVAIIISSRSMCSGKQQLLFLRVSAPCIAAEVCTQLHTDPHQPSYYIGSFSPAKSASLRMLIGGLTPFNPD